jgi:hypothetical protein
VGGGGVEWGLRIYPAGWGSAKSRCKEGCQAGGPPPSSSLPLTPSSPCCPSQPQFSDQEPSAPTLVVQLASPSLCALGWGPRPSTHCGNPPTMP